MFPSVDMVRRLAAVALDAAAPPEVRDAAIDGLGRREVRALLPQTRWPAEAVQLADEALLKLADAANAEGKIGSDRLPLALRHVSAEAPAWNDASVPLCSEL